MRKSAARESVIFYFYMQTAYNLSDTLCIYVCLCVLNFSGCSKLLCFVCCRTRCSCYCLNKVVASVYHQPTPVYLFHLLLQMSVWLKKPHHLVVMSSGGNTLLWQFVIQFVYAVFSHVKSKSVIQPNLKGNQQNFFQSQQATKHSFIHLSIYSFMCTCICVSIHPSI